ncbi:MAG: 1-deoxy-D-xylulose-5-phosphate reductoisomerase [Clostridia bacterium]|nr:1-deoxy-D-xylulose-5-phosphate reductoisomerase [Clostridia bacterium]
MERKVIAVLGATGSVGTQALDVARSRGYSVDLLSANSDTSGMELLARKFYPKTVVMRSERAAEDLKLRLADTNIRVRAGEDGLTEAIHTTDAETVINAVSGFAGLMPTLATIDSGKRLALANKESLVVAGEIVMSRARERDIEILPVDSEHSAIFQSLKSGRRSEVRRIILTASGGPFRDLSKEELERVTLEDTLAHPTWKMGKKITVDSATLMNKGFEVIEAVHLFGVAPSKVEVVVHRESILHSAVEYIDNSIIGEMSVPDMRMCVQYAVDYPDRRVSASPPLDLAAIGRLSFERPRYDAFPLLGLAERAIADGGAMPAVLNASDEVAVGAFLERRIRFSDIARVVLKCYDRLSNMRGVRELDGIVNADAEARKLTDEIIKVYTS